MRYTYYMAYWNKNKGIRIPVIDTNSTDFHVIGYATEKNHKKAEVVDNSTVSVYTVHYILDGSGYAIIDGIRHEIDADTIFVAFPNQNVQHSQDPEHSWRVTWFVVDGLKVKSILERAGITPEHSIVKLQRNKRLRSMLMTGPYDCRDFYEISDIIAQNHLLELFSFAYKNSITPPRASQDYPSAAEKYVQQTIDYINANYADESLNLNKIAQHIGISGKYLSSIFAEVVGIKFSRYLLNKRLAIANMLIEHGTTSVSEIAYKTGFSSPFYFSNMYKKYNIDSPRTHIKVQAKKIEQAEKTDKQSDKPPTKKNK